MTSSLANLGSAIVVGGGIIGLTSALALLDAGYAVTIVDDDAALNASSWGNAGHIAVEQIDPLASPTNLAALPRRLFGRGSALSLPLVSIHHWFPFAVRLTAASSPARFAAGRAALTALLADAMPAWKRLAARLGEPGLVVEEGHFIVWETPTSTKRGRENWLALNTPTAQFRDATPAEISQLADLMGEPPTGAIRCIGSGRIASHTRLHAALKRAIDQAGGRFVVGRASLHPGLDGHCDVQADRQPLARANLVIVAAGIGARALAESIGHTVPMIAERGYHLQSAGSAWPADLPPIVFEDRAMIVTRFESGVRASSFVEFASASRPADPRKWRSLRRRIAALNLPFEMPGREWMGARPTLPDYLPAIGRSTRARNLVYAFGHQHLGLTLGPITGEIVAGLATGQPAPLDLTPFDISRFDRIKKATR